MPPRTLGSRSSFSAVRRDAKPLKPAVRAANGDVGPRRRRGRWRPGVGVFVSRPRARSPTDSGAGRGHKERQAQPPSPASVRGSEAGGASATPARRPRAVPHGLPPRGTPRTDTGNGTCSGARGSKAAIPPRGRLPHGAACASASGRAAAAAAARLGG